MSYVYLSRNAFPALSDWLKENGHTPKFMQDSPLVYPAVSSHADIFICRLGSSPAAPLYYGNPAGAEYPACATLCAAANDKYFVHNTKITDPALLKKAEEIGLETIHVNQGFTRCNLLPVGVGFITSDNGICRTLSAKGISCLLISSGHIVLPGHNEGFIGGCGGIVGRTALFNGDITLHPDYKKIAEYIGKMGYGIKHFPGLPLTDIGSVIESDTLVNP